MLRADWCTPKTHVEVLTSSTPECDCMGDAAFEDITKLKWGEAWSFLTGVLIRRGDGDTDTHRGTTT